MILVILKICSAVWPFFKEWAFGGKTVTEAFKTNSAYTVFALSWFFLVAVSALLTFRIFTIGDELLDTKNKLNAADQTCLAPELSNIPTTKQRGPVNVDQKVINEMKTIVDLIECQELGKNCHHEKK